MTDEISTEIYNGKRIADLTDTERVDIVREQLLKEIDHIHETMSESESEWFLARVAMRLQWLLAVLNINRGIKP